MCDCKRYQPPQKKTPRPPPCIALVLLFSRALSVFFFGFCLWGSYRAPAAFFFNSHCIAAVCVPSLALARPIVRSPKSLISFCIWSQQPCMLPLSHTHRTPPAAPVSISKMNLSLSPCGFPPPLEASLSPHTHTQLLSDAVSLWSSSRCFALLCSYLPQLN